MPNIRSKNSPLRLNSFAFGLIERRVVITNNAIFAAILLRAIAKTKMKGQTAMAKVTHDVMNSGTLLKRM